MMDEIFGAANALGTLVWKRRSSSAMRGTPLSIDHEYVLAYAHDAPSVTMFGLSKGVEGYPHEDERGRYASTDLTVGMGRDARPGQFYPITNPRTGRVFEPNPERVWRFYPETMRKVIEQGLVIWPDEAEGDMTRPRYKTYYDPDTEKLRPVSSWIERPNVNDRELENDEAEYDVSILTSGMTQEGGKLLQQVLGSKVFAYPKPLSLVRSLIRAAAGPNDTVMDSFAGTGTTAHAVLDLNAEDGGNRRFLAVEMEEAICADITRERLVRVVNGYTATNGKTSKDVPGLGGGFRFCELSDPIFDETGRIHEDVRFAELAAHVFFTETGEPIPKRPRGKQPGPLLGVCNGTAVYLLFNGVLGDKRPGGGNVLTGRVLAELPAHDGPKVIYGEGCRLGDARLKRERVAFRQIPYEIKVS